MTDAVRVKQSFTILRPQEELYGFWRRLENLPKFMRHVESVEERDGGRSHWKVKSAADGDVEWDAEITRDDGTTLAWKTVSPAKVEHEGAVDFRPATRGRGTVVSVSLAYRSPAGRAGAAAAKLLGKDPEKQVRNDLRRFKQLVETGEIPTTEGQSSGRNEKDDEAQKGEES